MSNPSLARQVADKMIASDRYSAHLGIELIHAELEHSVCRMAIDERHLNGHGTCHGGAIFSLADTVFAHICNAGNRITVGHICNIAYWQAAQEGDVLYAVASAGQEYGRSGSYRVTVRRDREDGDIIAEFQGFSRALPNQTHF